MATICWASTSSGLRGYFVCSMSPSCMRCTTTADSTRSLRCLGKSFPRLGSPTWWPGRPTRCPAHARALHVQTPHLQASSVDLIDRVYRPHLDAELEGAGGDQALEVAPLE